MCNWYNFGMCGRLTMGLPVDCIAHAGFAERFGIAGITFDDVAETLSAERVELDGDGDFLGRGVPVMGFSWAVYPAQVTM